MPRHRFIRRFFANDPRSGVAGEWLLDDAVSDAGALALAYDPVRALALNEAGTSTISAPDVVAAMLDSLDLLPGQEVLEIGTGSGFNAALLATLVGAGSRVTTVDIDAAVSAEAREALARNGFGDVRVVLGDGALGVPDGGPFDRIVATVGCTDVAPAWVQQLAPEGVLLVPTDHGGSHPVLRLEPSGVAGELVGRVVTPAAFVRIAGVLDRALPWGADGRRTGSRREGAARRLPRAIRGAWAGHHRLWDVGWHVALVDHRARRLGALDDGEGSWAALEPSASSVSSAGSRGAELADALVAAATEWVDLGAPAAGDYRSRFVPRGAAAARREEQWQIERPHHVQLVSLGVRPAPAPPLG